VNPERQQALIDLLLPKPLPLIISVIFAASPFLEMRGLGVNYPVPMQKEYQTRMSANQRVQRTIAALPSIPENAVIVAAWKLPQIRHELRLQGKYDRKMWIYLVRDEDELNRYLAERRPIFFLRKIDSYEDAIYGIDLKVQCALPYPYETE
jgi:hypothetical protein